MYGIFSKLLFFSDIGVGRLGRWGWRIPDKQAIAPDQVPAYLVLRINVLTIQAAVKIVANARSAVKLQPRLVR
jgi:hypothetical protein